MRMILWMNKIKIKCQFFVTVISFKICNPVGEKTPYVIREKLLSVF